MLQKLGFVFVLCALLGRFGFSDDHGALVGRRAGRDVMRSVVSDGDQNYSRYPTAPLSIRGGHRDLPKEGEATIINEKYLFHKHTCHINAEQEHVDPDSGNGRFHVARKESDYEQNAKNFLQACRRIQTFIKENQQPPCHAVEIAGHANGMSIGLGKYFGFKIISGKWTQLPTDGKVMEDIVQCLKDIAPEEAPIIFSTCGGFVEEESSTIPGAYGSIFFMDKKQEASDLMANMLGRRVISARGPQNRQYRTPTQSYTHSRYGWYESTPKKDFKWKSDQLLKLLPPPTPLYNQFGTPLNVPVHKWNYDEINDVYVE